MMIPHQITRQHILEALSKIDSEGVPDIHQSTKFDLEYDGKRYPPKYAVSLAHIFVNGEKWPHERFSGGNETNNFLESRGFTIVSKDDASLNLPNADNLTHTIMDSNSATQYRSLTGAEAGLSGNEQIRLALEAMVANDGMAQITEIYAEVEKFMNRIGATLSAQGKHSLRRLINFNAVKTGYIYPHDPSNPGWRITPEGWDLIATKDIAAMDTHQSVARPIPSLRGKLQETSPPTLKPRRELKPTTFRTRKGIDYSLIDVNNRSLGLAGELLVLKHEKEILLNEGQQQLAENVRHTSQLEGDGAGYDIQSFTSDGDLKYIEVKTTRSSIDTPFYLTRNELEFARLHKDNYSLYRVYEYNSSSDTGKFFIVRGAIEDSFHLTPTQYRAARS